MQEGARQMRQALRIHPACGGRSRHLGPKIQVANHSDEREQEKEEGVCVRLSALVRQGKSRIGVLYYLGTWGLPRVLETAICIQLQGGKTLSPYKWDQTPRFSAEPSLGAPQVGVITSQ